MATATKTWDFTAGAAGFTGTSVGSETVIQSSPNGWLVDLFGKKLTADEGSADVTTGIHLTDTFANIFGIGASDTVTNFGNGASDGITWACVTFTTAGATNTAAGLTQSGLGGATSLDAGITVSGTTSDALNPIGSPRSGLSLAGSTSITLCIKSTLTTGNSSSADVQYRYRNLVLSITYTPAGGGGTTYTKDGSGVLL